MRKRKLGRHGPEVSAIGFGCMGLNHHRGPALRNDDAIALLRAAFDRGITFFDTAEIYGPFTNETIVGVSIAPPIPWPARESASIIKFCAMPPIADATVKRPSPKRNIRRRPKRSPNLPPTNKNPP